MKICVIQHTDLMGGSLSGAIEVIEMLKSCRPNATVDVYIFNQTGNALKVAEENKYNLVGKNLRPITFDYFNGCNSLFRILLKYCVRFSEYINWSTFFKENRYDIVLLNSSVLWPLQKPIREAGSQCYIYVRETIKGNKSGLINRLIRSKLTSAYGLFFLTRYDMKTWNTSCGNQVVVSEVVSLPDEDAVLRGNEIREALGLKKDDFLVLYLGGMQPIKGADIAIKALNVLVKSNEAKGKIKLIFLGDDGMEKHTIIKNIKYRKLYAFQRKMHTYINKNNLQNEIFFCGCQKKIYDWFAASDLGVFPVTKVHQARPLYEAGMMHRTIVVPNFDNYLDNYKDGINGLTFNAGDPEDLAKKILFLYKDKKLLRKLSENNHEMSYRGHTREIVRKVIDVVMPNSN